MRGHNSVYRGITCPSRRSNEENFHLVCLPRQGIPFCLRPLYLLDFREIRAGSWDIFGTVDSCDIAYWAGEISSRGEVTPASLYYVCICLRKNSYICWKMICLHVGGVHDGGFYKYGKWRRTVVVWKQ